MKLQQSSMEKLVTIICQKIVFDTLKVVAKKW